MNAMTIDATLPSSTFAPERQVDLFGPVHKGIRSALSAVLTRLGNTSFGDLDAAAPVLDELEAVLVFCEQHIVHEDRFLQPPLAACAPDAAASIANEHVSHSHLLTEIRALVRSVTSATREARARIGRTLYLHFSEYVADNLAHMAEEERVVEPLLRRFYPAEELDRIHAELVASLPPAELLLSLRYMIPAMDRDERAEMLGGMKAGAPPEAFAAVLAVVRGALAPDDWTDLARRLAI